MKLHIKLTGTFNRTPINSTVTETEGVTVYEWMGKHFAVATEVRQRTPVLFRKRFGMNFLSESSIDRLLQQTHSFKGIENLNLIPSWLQPSATITPKPILYSYEFVSQEAKIQLQPDDPQLPDWETDNITDTYEIVIEGDSYPGVSQTWLDRIWLEVKQEWSNYSSCDRFEMALQSSDDTEFGFYLPNIPGVKISLDLKQLTPEIQQAVSFLRQPETDIESLSSAARKLVQEYQQKSTFTFSLPKAIEPIASHHQFIIGKRISRNAIEELINQAEQFLCISSYVIESASITELICQKAATLPQGVWILTDLNNEVIDAIDTQVAEIPRAREAYQHSDAKKGQCLKLLLASGARIRGGAFHLKTYITEKAAYLGSCNLTGGSLDFNLESGLISQGTTTHRDLFQYFIRCWEHNTKYDVFPLKAGFIQRSLNNSSCTEKFSSQTLLTPRQYLQDLDRELSKSSEKVIIYSRSFFPDAEILSLLKTRPTYVSSVYYDNSLSNKNHRITIRLNSEIHAKVTLIGDRVAYLGGINFQFAPRGFSLIDLMYKTGDREEITQIIQQLPTSIF
ncbi:MAG: phospholipase D-like domain-containing protein [Pleurocapsa sp. MO_192.B19]|nr:phospholipase D-like domain-containing protein [Pleurocapsa sp. MO_192.B19]